MTAETPIRILGGLAGDPGRYLAPLRDADGKFFTPHLIGSGQRTPVATGNRIGIMDTGVMSQHPLLRNVRLLDVTGEGPEDLNGHGSFISLLLAGIVDADEMVSIKVLTASGEGTDIDFLKGLQLALTEGVDILNISAGSYDPACRGDCIICESVAKLAAAGLIVVTAAGNVRGHTDCPAKAGLYRAVAFSIAAFDIDAHEIAWYSGVGEFSGPVGRFELVPVLPSP